MKLLKRGTGRDMTDAEAGRAMPITPKFPGIDIAYLKTEAWKNAVRISNEKYEERGVRIPPQTLMPPDRLFEQLAGINQSAIGIHARLSDIMDGPGQNIVAPKIGFIGYSSEAHVARAGLAPEMGGAMHGRRTAFDRFMDAITVPSAAIVGAVCGFVVAGLPGAIAGGIVCAGVAIWMKKTA